MQPEHAHLLPVQYRRIDLVPLSIRLTRCATAEWQN
jgi:hypothetical protein